ncbi:hypothetical protein BP6252_13913 [Coleophoma cylindrospora]|uniref:FAD-binding domain-containing protein n=1 Tax=Coleophoma cylindrospora TaxID=1849047 RepID=A0A3D8Q5E4_9HELO|nr:hypothetical protein BP6252_13913 [Coleophoma cylindrospora]
MGDFISNIQVPPELASESGQHPSVQRYPLTGIEVLVVGGGVGGLTAALECYRKGHSVRIFERESNASTAGDMFSIGLSARRWLNHWPELKNEFDTMFPKVPRTIIKKHTGDIAIQSAAMGRVDPTQKDASEEPMAMLLRPAFHQMLHNQIRKLGIEITYKKRAIEYIEDSAKAYVITDDQQRASADVIIAADGIGSKSQQIINNGQVEAMLSGTAMYRAVCPSKLAVADQAVVKAFSLQPGEESHAQVWLGPNTHAVVFVQKDTITWALHYNESYSTTPSKESWHNTVEPSDVLRTISMTPGWGEGICGLIRSTPASCIINWPLIWRNPSPIWHSPQAHVIQVGDSAHSFLPTSGNGATQAIEDAITVATCLERAASSLVFEDQTTSPIPSIVDLAVRAHNKLRFERVSCAQKLGFANAFLLHHTDWDGAKKDPGKAQPNIPQWIWRHNPEAYAQERWDELHAYVTGGGLERESRGEESAFKNTNIPPGFQWSPWTLDDLVHKGKHGRVKLEGDWS